MGTLEIRHIAVDALRDAPGIKSLLREYARECAIDGLPKPDPEWLTYARLEHHGALQVLGAFVDDQLAGFCTVLVSLNPHYSVLLGVTESLFVGAHFRGTGAGMALLRAAERNAKERGAAAMLVSAPINGDLRRVLIGSKFYKATNMTFTRSLQP